MELFAEGKKARAKSFILILLFAAVILGFAHLSFAATSIWTGANSSDWTDAGNWSGGVPTSTTDVVIPDASTTPNDPNIASGAVCLSLTIDASGIINGNAQTITVYGNWTNNGTYNHGNGNIIFAGTDERVFTPGSSAYFNLELNKGTYTIWQVSGTATVAGNFTHTRGQMRNGQMDVAGNYVIGATAGGAAYTSTIVNLNSSSDQQIIYNAGGIGAQVRIDKAAGTLTLASDIVVNGWIYVRGTVAGLDTYALIFGDDEQGYFTPGSLSYTNIELNKTSTDILMTSGTATITGNFTHTDGQLRDGQFNLTGNYIIGTNAGGAAYTSTVINFNSDTNQEIIYSAGGVGGQIRVDKAAGTLTIPDNLVINGWIYVRGTVSGIESHTLIFGDNEYGYFTPGALVYNNIELNKTQTDSLITSGTAAISGNFIHTDGQLRYGQFDVAGNYIIGAAANGATYTSTIVNLNSAADQQIVYAAGGCGGQVRIDKAAGTLTVSSDINLTGWTYVQGTVVGMNTYALTFGDDENGSFTPGSLTYKSIVVNKTGTDDLTVSSGTLTISGDLTVTDGEMYFSTNNTIVNITGNVSITATGTLYAGTNPITVSGNWTNSGTFSHGNGRVVLTGTVNTTFTAGSSSYYDLELNKSATNNDLSVSGTATVANDFIQTNGEMRGGQLNVAGDYIIGAASDGIVMGYSVPTTIVNMNGANNQAITYNAGGIGAYVRIDKTGGTLAVSDNIVVNSWVYAQGTVSGMDSHTLILGDNCGGSFTPGSLVYQNIEINKSDPNYYGLYVTGTATVTGNLNFVDGETSGGQINLAGDYIIGSSALGQIGGYGATLTYVNFNDPVADQRIVYSAGGIGQTIRVDKTGGSLIVSDDIDVSGWVYVQGTVVGLDTYELIMRDNSHGAFTPGTMAYGDVTIDRYGQYYYEFTFGAGTAQIAGNLSMIDGNMRCQTNNPSFEVDGNFLIGSNAVIFKGTGTLTFTGTNPSTYTDSSSSQNIGKIVLAKTNPVSSQNKLTLLSDLLCDTMAVNADNTISLSAYTLTLANAGSTADVFALAGALDAGTGKVKYAATNSAGNINIPAATYHDLELSGAETYALSGINDISGNLAVGATSILSPGTSTVNLTGTNQALSGNASFYNLNKDISSLDTLTFQASSTTSILSGGTLVLKGQDRNNRLSLRSSSEDTPWNLTIDPAASYDFDYLDVQDSTASRTLTVLNSIDSGGNTNWSITNNTASSLSVPTVEVSAGIVTITTTAADIDQDDISIKAEYSDDGAIWQDPVLSTPIASLGSVTLNNANEYQLSGIDTTSSNTLSFKWDTRSILTYQENILVRLSPYDGTDLGATVQTRAFLVNNRAATFVPTKPDLSELSITSQDGTLRFENLPSSITEVAVSFTPDFTSSSYQPISFPILASSSLYLKFRTQSGSVSDTIVYSPSDITLNEGDIVKTIDNPDVYIIKYKGGKQYKRLILSPSVFNSYRHLKWNNIKIVTQSRLDSYTTSSLVYFQGDPDIYILTPLGDTGRRTVLNKTQPYDADSVYEINEVDRGSYGE